MNKIAKKTTLWGKWFVIFASLILCVGMGATQALAAADTTNNNFTMVTPVGGLTGGTNDVHFTWDGTLKSSVAASGQISNATISSTCPFQGVTWNAHDVAIYGPGTYTVYAGCASGSPGCGTGTPITFTVGAGELGAHMLFNWLVSTNIDVVDIWTPNAAFAPSPMWTGACGSQAATKVWDLMSTDWNGDGKNGYGMVDGPFTGQNANFNMMVCGNCDDSNVCTTDACDLSTQACTHTPVSCPGGAICDPVTGCFDCAISFNPALCTPVVCKTIVCNPVNVNGCDYAIDNTLTCTDNNLCTTDACNNGSCISTPISCDDSNACTTDSCDTATGTCLHVNVANGTACDDNNVCTTGDACSNGICLPGTVSPLCNQTCTPAPTLVSPTDGQGGLGTTMELRWTKCVDPDNDPVKYHITYCITPNAVGCPSVLDVADAGRKNGKSVFYASGAGLLMIGMTFIGGFKGRKKIIALLIIVTLFAGGAFMSCKNTKNVDQTTALGANEMNFMVSGLTPSTTYYWNVQADDNRGGLVTSPTQSFTTM